MPLAGAYLLHLCESLVGAKNLSPLLVPDDVRHGRRNDERYLHKAAVFAVSVPWSLIDEPCNAVFLDGVDIGLLLFHELSKLGVGRFGVAVQQVGTHELPAAAFLE